MPKSISELMADRDAATTAEASAQADYEAAQKAVADAQEKVKESQTALSAAKSHSAQVNAELLQALGVHTPIPAPSPLPVPSPSNSHNNAPLYIIIVAVAVMLANQFGLISFHKFPEKPEPPKPAPVNNDPLRVSYIYDKDNVTQDIGQIRDNIEKVQSALSPLNAKYRNYDVNEQEVKDNLMPAVNSVNGQLPILVVQDAKTGKLVGNIISSPKTYQDIINAVKNVRR